MESHLHWADYLILVGFLVISLAIGIYHSLTGGRQKTTAEFIMANRKLKVIPTAISLFVFFQSGMLFLGMTAEMYCYGIQYLIYFIATVPPALFLIERIVVPWLYPLKLVSIYDVILGDAVYVEEYQDFWSVVGNFNVDSAYGRSNVRTISGSGIWYL